MNYFLDKKQLYYKKKLKINRYLRFMESELEYN